VSKSKPKAHIFMDGEGGLVTGTHDIEIARDLMRIELRSYYEEDEISEYDFTEPEPVLQIGRIVPAPSYSDYSWFWKGRLTEADLGKRGVTRGVVWNA
jgi:hypothetical protein